MREQITKHVKLNFEATASSIKVLHWDGKLLKEVAEATGEHFKQENLAILVTCPPDFDEGKLLGIPKVSNAKGVTTKDAILELLEEWGISLDIFALVFDTTSSNSGIRKGAAVLIEQALDYKVLYFGCRHHVAELLASAAWGKVFVESNAPNNLFFQRISRSVDKDVFQTQDFSNNSVWLQQ